MFPELELSIWLKRFQRTHSPEKRVVSLLFDAVTLEDCHGVSSTAEVQDRLLEVFNHSDRPMPEGQDDISDKDSFSHFIDETTLEDPTQTLGLENTLNSQCDSDGYWWMYSKGVVKAERHDTVVIPTSPLELRRSSSRSRKGLPLLFEIESGYEKIMTGHDSGTEANHMSLELAQRLGYGIDTKEETRAEFMLPNGKIMKALGRVTARVQFAQGARSENASYICYFNVFKTLALPALIGMAFLSATETLTTHTSRLAPLSAGWKRSLRLCAVGNATNQVTCLINGWDLQATADTGAEIALISRKCVTHRGLLYSGRREILELADGSRVQTSGFADLKFSILTPSRKLTETVRFHVLRHLQVDVVLDEHIIDGFKIFQESNAHILSAASTILPMLGPIIHLRKIEQKILDAKDRIVACASKLRSSQGQIVTRTTASSSTEEAALRIEIETLDQAELRRRAVFEEKCTKKMSTSSEDISNKHLSFQYRVARKTLIDRLQVLTGA